MKRLWCWLRKLGGILGSWGFNMDNFTLDSATEFIVDCLHKTAPTQENGTPLIRTPNIGRGRFNLEGVQRISTHTYEQWTIRGKPEKDDLILAREAPAGNVAIIKSDEPFCLGQRTVHIRPKKNLVDPDFLVYFMLAPKQQANLLKHQVGVHVGHVNMKDIRRLPLDGLPALHEQKKLAEVIANYDDLIENNRRRIQLLEESARLLYKEWFVHLRFPGHEHVKITDGVPEGWEKKLLSEAIAVNPKTPVEKGKDIKYVPMSSLSENGMTANEKNFEIRSKHTNVKFQLNDVLLARITPCLENGKTGFVYFLDENEVACGSTEFIVLRGKDVSPVFTYCLARSYPLREKAIKSMIGSSGRQRVQLSCFDKFVVAVPSQFLIQQFDEIVNNLFAQIKVLMQENKRLIQARDILLPRLMNGELTV